MELFDFSENRIINENTCITIGKFDGVHLGHMELIRMTKRKAKKMNLKSVVMLVYAQGNKRITNVAETCEILSDYDVDYVILCPLTESFLNTSGEDFLKDTLIQRFSMKVLVSGENFRFGKDGSCDSSYLDSVQEKENFLHVTVPSVYVDGEHVSSSKIRTFLEEGNLNSANRFLGYDFRVTGKVVHGAHLGTELGFPTVNIAFPDDGFVPKFGVYACRTELDGKEYRAIANVGVKPTVTEVSKPLFEAHISGFSGDLYGRTVTFSLERFLRPEKRFSSVSELKNQINEDLQTIL